MIEAPPIAMAIGVLMAKRTRREMINISVVI
jgi:hypothetical protein